MIELPTQEVIKSLVDYDSEAGTFVWRARGVSGWDSRWAGKPAFACDWNGYKVGTILGRRTIGAHRVAFKYVHGFDPDQVDHINGKRDDNRICNLRAVTSKMNNRNMCLPNHNTSGSIGVSFRKEKRKWRAFATLNNKAVHIGYFASRKDAEDARSLFSAGNDFHENHGRKPCK